MDHLFDIGALLTGIASIIAACGSAYSSYLSYKNGHAIEVIRKSTNGITTQLLEATGDRKYAEGVIQGEDFPRRRPRRPRHPKRKKR